MRKSVSHRVTVDNPMPTQVTFHTNVNTLDISLPATFEAGAESEVSRGLQPHCASFLLTLEKARSSGQNVSMFQPVLMPEEAEKP